MARAVLALLLVLSALVASACAGGTTPSVSDAPPTSAGTSAPTTAAPTPTNTDAAILADVPRACYGLGPEDCAAVVEEIQSELDASDPIVTYIQVGPFGCDGAERCPTTLAARPQGDVTLEAGDGAFSFHATATGAVPAIDFVRQDAFGIKLAATSQPPLALDAQPYTLGHCGLWSGIDLGGSWWDPVGPIDGDHPDAINSAAGVITVVDPDHAMFTSNGGLTVELLRHKGEKFLPLCR